MIELIEVGKIKEFFDLAEKALSEAKNHTGQLCIGAVNELRYAEQHLISYLYIISKKNLKNLKKS